MSHHGIPHGAVFCDVARGWRFTAACTAPDCDPHGARMLRALPHSCDPSALPEHPDPTPVGPCTEEPAR